MHHSMFRTAEAVRTLKSDMKVLARNSSKRIISPSGRICAYPWTASSLLGQRPISGGPWSEKSDKAAFVQAPARYVCILFEPSRPHSFMESASAHLDEALLLTCLRSPFSKTLCRPAAKKAAICRSDAVCDPFCDLLTQPSLGLDASLMACFKRCQKCHENKETSSLHRSHEMTK